MRIAISAFATTKSGLIDNAADPNLLDILGERKAIPGLFCLVVEHEFVIPARVCPMGDFHNPSQ